MLIRTNPRKSAAKCFWNPCVRDLRASALPGRLRRAVRYRARSSVYFSYFRRHPGARTANVRRGRVDTGDIVESVRW